MFYSRQTSVRLHQDHLATIQLWSRLENAIAARASDEQLAPLYRQCAVALAEEVTRHFGFEEQELFTRLAQAGDSDIAGLLSEEHETIREVGGRFQALATQPQPDAATRKELRALGVELAERMVSHVQKEEMALLPALEDLIDEDTDRELALRYASQ